MSHIPAAALGCKVIAVEPCGRNFSVLSKNAEMYSTSPGQCVIVNKAVATAGGTTTTLYRHPRTGFRHTTVHVPSRREVWVGEEVPATFLVLSINLIHCGNEFRNSV